MPISLLVRFLMNKSLKGLPYYKNSQTWLKMILSYDKLCDIHRFVHSSYLINIIEGRGTAH